MKPEEPGHVTLRGSRRLLCSAIAGLTAAASYAASPGVLDAFRQKDGDWLAAARILAQRGQQHACGQFPDWRCEQIEAAVPVTSISAVYRSGEPGGASIVTVTHKSPGNVDELVVIPERIDFRAVLGSSLLVLPVSKTTLDAAPQFPKGQVQRPGELAARGRVVDAYWAAHPPLAMR